jgi:hypothetical protein
VVVGRLRTETDLLDLDLGLRFAGLAFLLGLLVQELPVVEDAADGRIDIRGNLNQVEGGLLGQRQGFPQGNDTQVLAIGPDEANLTGADLFVDAEL